MALKYQSLRDSEVIQELEEIDGNAFGLLWDEAGQLRAASYIKLRDYFTESVSGRIDALEELGVPTIWPASRSFTLSGVVEGSGSTDGSTNVTIATTINPGSIAISDIDQLSSTLSDLESDIGDKLDATATAVAATRLETARAITLSGLVTGTASFDGTDNATIETAIADGALTMAKVNGLNAALTAKMDTGAFGLGGFVSSSSNLDDFSRTTMFTGVPGADGTNPALGALTHGIHLRISATRFSQLMMSNPGRAFFRTVVESDPESMAWNEFYHSGNFDPDSKLDASISDSLILDRGELGATVNLDTVVDSGIYFQRTAEFAESGENYPVQEPGVLSVFASTQADNLLVFQTYHDGTLNRVFTRVRSLGGVWSSWTNITEGTGGPGDELDASAITTGTFPVARGGTGRNTLTAGSFLVGNGTGQVQLVTASQARENIIPDGSLALAKLDGFDTAMAAKVDKTQQIIAGNGLVTGGALSGDVTVDMGTPSTISGSTTNAATADSHTHELSANLKLWDAVTPDQFAAKTDLAASMLSVAEILGGGTTVDEDGFLGDSNFEVQAIGYGAVGDAIGQLDSEISALKTDSAVVRTTGNQTIQGLKTFQGTSLVGLVLERTSAINPSTIVMEYKTTQGSMYSGFKSDAGWFAGPQSNGDNAWVRANGTGLYVNGQEVYHAGNLSMIPETRSISAGNGLTGGGDLSANRTITLGTPSVITPTTSNSVSTSSHTHALSMTWGEGSVQQSTVPNDFPSNVVSMTRVGAASGTGWPEYGLAATFATNAGRHAQLYFGSGFNKLYFRTGNGDGTDWNAMQEVYHSGNQLALGTTQSDARSALGLGTAATAATGDFVGTSGNQAVSGTKTFSNNPIIANSNARLVLRDTDDSLEGTLNVNTGVFWLARSTPGNMYLRPSGLTSTEGQVVISPTVFSWNGNTILHSGNLSEHMGSDVVLTSGTQSIGGGKTFTNAVTVGDTFDNRIYLPPRNGTTNPSVAINYSTAGNVGFYDTTNSSWLFRIGLDKSAQFYSNLTVNGSLSMGGSTASAPDDFSKHIQLHNNGYGFTVTSGRLNYRADSSASANHVFSIGGSDRMWVSDNLMTFGADTDGTADVKTFRVISNGYAGIVANGDVSNISGEPGGSFFAATLDGSAHTGGTTLLMSMINSAGEDGSGGSWTGTSSNSALLAVRGNYRLQLGSNNLIAMYVQGANAVFNGDVSVAGALSDSTGNLRTDIDAKAPTTRSISAGNGLSGGGTLAANRTITLGTPSTLTSDTTNAVTTSSHTHEVLIEHLWHVDDRSGVIRTTPDTYRFRGTQVGFNSGANVGIAGTYATTWTNVPWSAYSNSYRPVQIIFPGDGHGLYFRRAASATTWDTMYKIYTEADPVVLTSTTITAGNGLSGGGTLAANRTITLGTPSTIGPATANSVTSTSHTHNLDLTANYTWSGLHTFDGDIAFPGTHGAGIRFWNSSNYSIYMSQATNATYGGRIYGDTNSDYNIYYKIGSGTNRGHVFVGTSGILAQMRGNGEFLVQGNIFNGMTGGSVGGYAGLISSSSTGRSGSVAFYNRSDGSRSGYIGNSTSSSIIYGAEGGRNHSFNADVYGPDFIISSDRKLKREIQDLKIQNDQWLRPRTFYHIEHEQVEDGFIAQEVQELYPNTVCELEGNLHVKYPRLTAALAAQDLVLRDQIRSQAKTIEELQSALSTATDEVATMKEQMANLMSQVQSLLASRQ